MGSANESSNENERPVEANHLLLYAAMADRVVLQDSQIRLSDRVSVNKLLVIVSSIFMVVFDER